VFKMLSILKAARKYLDKNKQIPSLPELQDHFKNWIATKYGQYIIQKESSALKNILPDINSHRMMQLGLVSQLNLSLKSHHLHSFSFGPLNTNILNSAVSDFDTLPLPSATIDTVFLHHALEFSQHPHEVLKEASRVLKPSGYIVMVIFNPVSMLGLLKFPARLLSSNAVWRHHGLRRGRVLDWLKLLSIMPAKSLPRSYSLPCSYFSRRNAGGFLARIAKKYQMFFGAFYIIVAKKYVSRAIFSENTSWESLNIPVTASTKKSSVDS
jgi:SAM-dependent methyltransferase